MSHLGLQSHLPFQTDAPVMSVPTAGGGQLQTLAPIQSFPRRRTGLGGVAGAGILASIGSDIFKGTRFATRKLKTLAFGGGGKAILRRTGALGIGLTVFDILRQLEKDEGIGAMELAKRQVAPKRIASILGFGASPLFAGAGKVTGITESVIGNITEAFQTAITPPPLSSSTVFSRVGLADPSFPKFEPKFPEPFSGTTTTINVSVPPANISPAFQQTIAPSSPSITVGGSRGIPLELIMLLLLGAGAGGFLLGKKKKKKKKKKKTKKSKKKRRRK